MQKDWPLPQFRSPVGGSWHKAIIKQSAYVRFSKQNAVTWWGDITVFDCFKDLKIIVYTFSRKSHFELITTTNTVNYNLSTWTFITFSVYFSSPSLHELVMGLSPSISSWVVLHILHLFTISFLFCDPLINAACIRLTLDALICKSIGSFASPFRNVISEASILFSLLVTRGSYCL